MDETPSDDRVEGDGEEPPTASVEDEAAAEERESRELWEAHFDARLSFLPHQDAVLTDLVDESTKEQADFYKRLDPRVIERFLECEERTESTRLNLSCLGLQMVPIKQAIFQRLKVLSLRDNCLTDVPTEAFTCMYQLETLILSHNKLRAIPDTISALVNLRKLVASHNELQGSLGPGLFLCTKLREVDLSHNAITRVPEDIKAFRGLQALVLGFNQLSDLPAMALNNLAKLSVLDLRGNPLDIQALPDRLLLLNEQYVLARSKEERTRMVGRAVVLKGKIHEAYRKNLVRQRQTFSIADPTQGSK